jgi:hypothetical protein
MKSLIAASVAFVCLAPSASFLSAGPPAVAPYVDEHTFAVLHVNVKDVELDAAWKRIKGLLPAPELAKQLEPIQAAAAQARAAFLQTGAKELYVLLNWAEPLDGPGLIVVPIPDGADKEALFAGMAGLFKTGGFEAKVDGHAVLLGKEQTLKGVATRQAKDRPDISKALEATGAAPIRAAVVPPDSLRKALQENMPNLPKELGGASIDTLNKGIMWFAAGISPNDNLGPRLVIQSKDSQAAEALTTLWKQVLESAGRIPDIQDGFPKFAQLSDQLMPKVKGDRLTMALDEKTLVQAVCPAVDKLREAAARTQSINNLKQMGLAMHSYHDVNKVLPAAATYDANGKPLLSWRVHVLPYIEQNDLYKQFKLDEPWDSEHNKKLIPLMPEIYRSPLSKAAKGKTTYLVPVGPKTIFEGKNGMSIAKITDGTSNTILIVEADDAKAVEWTRPADYKIDAKDPRAGLVRAGAKGFPTAFADGSVRMLSATINLDTLRALFTATGGEVVNPDD